MSCASDLLQYKILCIFDKVELWQCNYVCIEITDEEEIQYWSSVMCADKRVLEKKINHRIQELKYMMQKTKN
jgi:hypothetical protein